MDGKDVCSGRRPGFVSLEKFFIRSFWGGSTPDQPRECSKIQLFATMLGCMKYRWTRHVDSLVTMFRCLVAGHQRHVSDNLCHCYYDEAGACARSLVQLYDYYYFSAATTVDTSGKLENLLTCFSDERFHAGGIRESNFLIEQLANESRLGAVLIRHGFKYSFHQKSFEICCVKLILARNYNFRLRMDALKSSGNLRRQMAVVILMHLVCYEDRMNRELFCMLWMSVPEPFITPDELYHLMEPYFVPSSALVDRCVKYRDLFPWVPEVKQPQSLKHLARVRIRDSMVRAHSIGEKAIRSLGLPRSIEDYLWKLEEF